MANGIKNRKPVLGDISMRLLSYAQLKNTSTMRIGDFRNVLGLSEIQERKLLSRLADSGIIVRLKRGVYLIPDRLPPGGKYNPGLGMILNKLFEELKGSYQICGPAAFNFYGFSDQITNLTHVYNDRISGDRRIGNISFEFIKTSKERLGEVEEIKTDEDLTVSYSAKYRTLIDAVYDWSRFNSLPQAFDWIKKEVGNNQEKARHLISIAMKYGNQSTKRRIGYLLDSLNVSSELLVSLRESLTSGKSVIPFVPETSTKGTVNATWGVIENG